MSLTRDPAADAQIATGTAGWHWLVEMYFSGGTQYLTTAPVERTWAGNLYLSAVSLEVQAVRESADAGVQEVTLSVPVVDGINLATFMGPATAYRNRKLKLRQQVYDDRFRPVGEPTFLGSWRMQPVRVERRASAGGSSGRILLPCTRSGWERVRSDEGLRHTHQQQLARYPGDMGLQYLQGLIDDPVVWLSKRFQASIL